MDANERIAIMDAYAAETPRISAWERWVAVVERQLGHSLDGDEATDGYSLDGAYDAFRAGVTPREYTSSIIRR